MPQATHIKTLGSVDSPTMRQMLGLFGKAFEDLPTYAANQPEDAYLAELLARETFVAIAAFAEATLVGGLAAYVLPKFEQARAELYIYDLAVEESHRRRGIATAMIEELRRIAASRRIYVIFVQADRDDEAAIRLYTKLGQREDVIHFDIEPSARGA